MATPHFSLNRTRRHVFSEKHLQLHAVRSCPPLPRHQRPLDDVDPDLSERVAPCAGDLARSAGSQAETSAWDPCRRAAPSRPGTTTRASASSVRTTQGRRVDGRGDEERGSNMATWSKSEQVSPAEAFFRRDLGGWKKTVKGICCIRERGLPVFGGEKQTCIGNTSEGGDSYKGV